MKIAIEGCAHGELEKIYDSLEQLQLENKCKVDLLICCGDFQATRNTQDLQSMAVPPKYQKMCSFYKYYSGEKVAPVLTIFIGGNHEASNHLQELYYGGWAAPNIYFLGYAGVVNVGGIKIAGLSGIYKPRDYMKGHFEKPPYNENTKRSVFHTRNLEVFRLKQLKEKIDIFISHDWPRGIYKYGNTDQLLKIKPYFSEEIANDDLGSPACEELLFELKPMYWFSAHLHCKFAALVPHKSEEKGHSKTKFLALDKCLPNRKFLQVLDIPHDTEKPLELEYDLEWVTILHFTNHLTNIKSTHNYLPGPGGDERWNFTPTEIEKDFVHKKMLGDLKVPQNFCRTASPHDVKSSGKIKMEPPKPNPQTTVLCEKIGISDPLALILESYDSLQTKKSPMPESPEDNNIGSGGDSDLSFLYSSNEEFNISSPWLPDSSNEDLSPKAKGRVNILLPPPKFASSPLAGDEDIIIIEDRLSSSVENSKEENSNQEEKEANPESPHVKKFKRRNHSLYQEEKCANEEESVS